MHQPRRQPGPEPALDCSVASRSLIVGRQPANRALGSERIPLVVLRGNNSAAVRGQSIPREPEQGGAWAPVLLRVPVGDRGLALVPVSERVQALVLVQVPAARQLLKVLLAHSALHRAAAAGASNNTRRPKKAR